MAERDRADLLDRDVEILLHHAGRSEPEPIPAGYEETVEVARALAGADWSAESGIRGPLRRRLLARAAERRAPALRSLPARRHLAVLPSRRRVLATAATALLGILIAVGLARPDLLVVLAENVRQAIRQIRLSPYVTMVQTGRPAAPAVEATHPAVPVVEWRGDLWIVHTPIGNFAGDVLPGRPEAVQTFATLEELQAAAPFAVRRPAYLPPGSAFREGMLTPFDWTLLFYEGGLVVAQVPVGSQPSSEPGTIRSNAAGLLTDAPIVEITLNGQPAGWVDGWGVMWTQDGMSYIVGGPDLDLAETLRIAESLSD